MTARKKTPPKPPPAEPPVNDRGRPQGKRPREEEK